MKETVDLGGSLEAVFQWDNQRLYGIHLREKGNMGPSFYLTSSSIDVLEKKLADILKRKK